MGKENHVFAPAYKDADIKELGEICDHIIFNSFAQLRRHKDVVSRESLGLRINPECSTQGIMQFMTLCSQFPSGSYKRGVCTGNRGRTRAF